MWLRHQKNSGEIKINGTAAILVHVGDPVIIIAYEAINEVEANNFQPKVVLLDDKNRIK